MTEQQSITVEKSSCLNDVPQDKQFILSNGITISNLESLLNILRDTDDSIFYYHVTDSKNDFANWIKGCIKHEKLSEKLMGIKQKEPFLYALDAELELLKNPKLAETKKFFEEDMGEEKKTDETEKFFGENIDEEKKIGASKPEDSAAPESIDSKSALGVPHTNTNAVVLDFEQFLEPLIREFESEIAQSDQ